MDYKISIKGTGSELAITVNGKTFKKSAHRFVNEQGESAQYYREPLLDLLSACARYEKLHNRTLAAFQKPEQPTETE